MESKTITNMNEFINKIKLYSINITIFSLCIIICFLSFLGIFLNLNNYPKLDYPILIGSFISIFAISIVYCSINEKSLNT